MEEMILRILEKKCLRWASDGDGDGDGDGDDDGVDGGSVDDIKKRWEASRELQEGRGSLIASVWKTPLGIFSHTRSLPRKFLSESF